MAETTTPNRASDASEETDAAVTTSSAVTCAVPPSSSRGAAATTYVAPGYTTKSPYAPLRSGRCRLYAPRTSARVSRFAAGTRTVRRKYAGGGSVAVEMAPPGATAARRSTSDGGALADAQSGYSLARVATMSTSPDALTFIATTNVSAPTRSTRALKVGASPSHPATRARKTKNAKHQRIPHPPPAWCPAGAPRAPRARRPMRDRVWRSRIGTFEA